MELNCIIVDDEPLALDLLESYVAKTPFLYLAGRCENATDVLEIIGKEQIDVAFLDIQMPELNGLELSRLINHRTKIIFTTAFEQYALEGFKVDALDYLLKPFTYAEFLKAASKALHWFEMVRNGEEASRKTRESIFVKSDYKLIQIELRNILYIEGVKDYIKIQTEEGPTLTLMSMKTIEEHLPPDRFIRVHRSFIVNIDKIRTIERNRIVFGKTYIPISDSHKEHFMALLQKRTL